MLRPVRRRVGRFLMRLDEDAGDADRHRRPRQDGHKFALAAREAPCPPGCCTAWVASKITGAPISPP